MGVVGVTVDVLLKGNSATDKGIEHRPHDTGSGMESQPISKQSFQPENLF